MKRIPSLDGLRAVSITAVVLSHLAKSGHAPRVFWDHFGATGVSIFFVISGYLITTLLLNEKRRTGDINLRVFYFRRTLRIFPAAITFLVVAVAIYWKQLQWYHIAAAFLYVANYDLSRPWIFGHLWSLSIEEQFYLLWPSIMKVWGRWSTAILVGAMLVGPFWQIMSYALKWKLGLAAFPSLVGNLAAGCLLATVEDRVPRIGRWSALLMAAGVIFIPFFAANSVARTVFMVLVLRPLLYVSIAGVLLHVVRRPYWILNCAPVVWLGRISYSVYLWQQPFCADPKLHHGYFVIFAILCACFSYYMIEQPVLKLRESLGQKVKEPFTARASSAFAA